MNFNSEKNGLSWSTILIILIGVSLLMVMVSPGGMFMDEEQNTVSPKTKVAENLGVNRSQLQFKGLNRNTLGYCGWVSTSRSPAWQRFLISGETLKLEVNMCEVVVIKTKQRPAHSTVREGLPRRVRQFFLPNP